MTRAPASRALDTTPLWLKLSSYLVLSEEEKMYLADLERTIAREPPRTDLLQQGEKYRDVRIIRDGWAIRHKALPDGRRQVVNFVLPGDIIGMYCTLFESADHSVTTLTAVEVASFPPERIGEMFRSFPRLAAALAWSGAREEAMVAERLLSLGRRTALERTAHLIVELLRRLSVVNMATDGHFVLPVTQEILADALGLSIVHINRTLRRLRDSGLIELNGQRITVNDVRQLASVGQFDELYLHLIRVPKRLERAFAGPRHQNNNKREDDDRAKA
ncbi:Crp/Fnr family transcriptional regulator [Azospirillum sp. YIM B02556]|uniref:Crp/Fnr family transcriptional regulator n=1 Tax=Azospirillum endophyticum TaxID=2800326 RepID=A0ABS1F743_9PROT|nr:Crp/Fnr family transcriptional regulator [Azospirillum endophyticum]MBK1839244.1 Crp/Fnr family transcriptional regulator [Azospirillum endophyticum]